MQEREKEKDSRISTRRLTQTPRSPDPCSHKKKPFTYDDHPERAFK